MKDLVANAHEDTDGSWTITIAALTSPGPNGNTIVATGSSPTRCGIEQAAHELAAAWLDDDTATVTVGSVTPAVDSAPSS